MRNFNVSAACDVYKRIFRIAELGDLSPWPVTQYGSLHFMSASLGSTILFLILLTRISYVAVCVVCSLHAGWAYLAPRMDEMTTRPLASTEFQLYCLPESWYTIDTAECIYVRTYGQQLALRCLKLFDPFYLKGMEAHFARLHPLALRFIRVPVHAA